VVINARVATSPETLRGLMQEAVHQVCRQLGAQATFAQTLSFRPGRPVPTHRFAKQSESL
jgi:hypothetical protein